MTEQEMRDMKAPWPKTWDELRDFCEPMFANENDDYGKAVYCMSLAATAMFNFAASKVGATGFQASCADLDILRRTRDMEHGFQIVDYERALYPQYLDPSNADYAALQAVFPQIAPRLIKAAKKNLAEAGEHTSPHVIAHWERIAALPEPKDD